MEIPPSEVIERVVRESYGRLVSYLSANTGDIADSEAFLSDALTKALKIWPESGVPKNPEAWLLAVARRTHIDAIRRERIHSRALDYLAPMGAVEAPESSEFPDRRVQLLFACAHPDIDPSAQTPLMLNTILGLTAERIASAFLIHPSNMGQRLVRAKRRIRELGIPFQIPESELFCQRRDAVLEAIYAAFGIGWESNVPAGENTHADLAEESIYLGRVLLSQMPQDPEVLGLVAFMMYVHARRAARFSTTGHFVPLLEQDPKDWDHELLDEADRLLTRASKRKEIGRFQLLASIQSAQTVRRHSGAINWEAILVLYHGLNQRFATVGSLVGLAAALFHLERYEQAAAALAELPKKQTDAYQPYWVLKALIFEKSGDLPEAQAARSRAVGLTESPAIRAFLSM
ncbi:MAG: DUF6596 domain-containing protein [Verrucomicrobiota bacterium]